MVSRASYTLTKGLPWERMVVVKDRRTRRLIKVTEARGAVKTSATGRVEFDITITNKGEILIALTDEETNTLPTGDLEFDVIATCTRSIVYPGQTATITQPVVRGIISVEASNNITPSEDSQTMEIRFKQHVDFRRTFTWRDSDGDVITIQNAYLQAVDSTGATALDLRWYSTVPNEATITGLTGNRRGYLAPATGATLEMHVSDKNTIAAGSYAFDLFVQDTAGDWDNLAAGTIIVTAAVASPPA